MLKEGIDVDAEDDCLASTNTKFVEFPALKTWIKQFLEENRQMNPQSEHRNILIKEVLAIAKHCAIFGYYTRDQNVEELVTCVCELLDVETDIKAPLGTSYEIDQQRKHYTAVKVEGLELLQIIGNLQLRHRMFFVMKLFSTGQVGFNDEELARVGIERDPSAKDKSGIMGKGEFILKKLEGEDVSTLSSGARTKGVGSLQVMLVTIVGCHLALMLYA